MSGSIQVLGEIDLVVERNGYGAHVWRWRLSNGSVDVAASDRAFRCAEDAYREGKTNLLTLRAGIAQRGRGTVELEFAEDIESFEFAAEA